MKKMVVCGDSWMSPSIMSPNTHFTQIVAEKLNLDLICLSRGGMSNGGICAQIESAIDMNPDLIIFNTTCHDRIEVSIEGSYKINNINNPDRFSQDLNDTNRNKITAKNILYRHKQYITTYSDIVSKDPRIISDNLISLLTEDDSNFGNIYDNDVKDMKSKKRAIKEYFSEIYNHQWKQQIDMWCMEGIISKLYHSNINFLLTLDILRISKNIEWLPKKYIGFDYDQFYELTRKDILESNELFNDPGYHTVTKSQEFLANETIKKLSVSFNLLNRII